jgi:hypothetical protein
MLSSDQSYRRYTYFSMGRYKKVGKTPGVPQKKYPAHGSYGNLLFDPRWKSKRQEILNRDRHQCIICSSDKELHVHHRQYHYLKTIGKFKPPWDYDNQLMITLCSRCHRKGHSSYNIPIINI